MGFGFERGEGSSDKDRYGLHLSDTNTDVWQGSLNASYREGRFGMGVSVAGSNNSFETRRMVKINGFAQHYTTFDGIFDPDHSFVDDEQPIFTDHVRVFEGVDGDAVGASDLWAVNPRLRLSYAMGSRSLQATPYVDVDAFFARIDDAAEAA